MKKYTAFVALILAMLSIFTSCRKTEEASLYVEVVAYRINESDVNNVAAELKKALPNCPDMDVSGISLDDPGAGFQIVVLMFASEIEFFICDASVSEKLAAQGENFIALEDLFSKEELSQFNGTGVSFPKYDDNNVLTGEMSHVCGLDLSESENAVNLTGLENPQIFIVASAKNLEAAKDAFRYMATL
ncbi:MAG: hypothetical protein IJO48_02920 [Clostridia bacterium]|nr:hypothetical protein [Clostridia bacterium]